MLDVQVVDLFHQAVRQVRFIQQTFQPDVPGHQCRWLKKKLLGYLQHRLDLRFDTRLAGDFVGRVQQVRHLSDVGTDKPGHDRIFVELRQMNGCVKVWQRVFQLASEQACIGLMLLGTQDLLAQGSGVHGHSRGTLDREYR